MKRAIINYFDLLQEKMAGYVSMLSFRYMNLCIKAEEASLIPVQVPIEGELKKLEDVAMIGKKGDYSFMIMPKYDDEMDNIAQGIAIAHPEFKQKRESMDVSGVDDNGKEIEGAVPYLLLTMPEVNDDRYDVLKDGVDLFYKDIKARMDAAIAESKVKFATLLQGESAEDIDSLNDGVDKVKKEFGEKRDKLRDDKLKEIEDAHNEWLSHKSEVAKKNEEFAAARGENAGSTLRMGEYD